MATHSLSAVTILEKELSSELVARRHEIIARVAKKLNETCGRCCELQLELQNEYYRTERALEATDEWASISQLHTIIQPKPHLIDEIEGAAFYSWSSLNKRLKRLWSANYSHLWAVAEAKNDFSTIDMLAGYDY